MSAGKAGVEDKFLSEAMAAATGWAQTNNWGQATLILASLPEEKKRRREEEADEEEKRRREEKKSIRSRRRREEKEKKEEKKKKRRGKVSKRGRFIDKTEMEVRSMSVCLPRSHVPLLY